ncbi:ASKHA domain-containing protein [Phosphitispora sp. TUW77]|uniref:ASKHA domain-containing protein n=1 Tax=Phosphitispora sp. TUW77 TaxID=3152361 RepID=UPI003AB4ABFE
MTTIKFMPQGINVEATTGASVLELAQKAGVGIRAECGGRGVCGSCRVMVEPLESFSPPSAREIEMLGDDLDKGWRLACHTKVLSAGTVIIPLATRPEQVIVLEESYGNLDITLKPAVRQLFLHVPEPTLDNPRADGERFLQTFKSHTKKLTNLEHDILMRLPNIIREEKGQVTATVWQERKILDLKSGYHELILGIAVDLGTTTMVVYLFNIRSGQLLGRASQLNPQTAYGSDVMTRIHYTSNTKGGSTQMRATVVRGLNQLISEVCDKAQVSTDNVVEVVLVGNTAMHHLCLGLDSRHLALAPYPPVWAEPLDLPAAAIGMAVHPAANLHLLPNKAGFVGADSMAVLLALEPYLQDELQLIIDFGTNGEIILANSQHQWACSTAAGPAFEGAQIRFGMRAQNGAIDKVEFIPESQEIRWETIGGEPPIGICGSGIIAVVAALRKAGILHDGGRFNSRINNDRLRHGAEGMEYVLAWPEETALGEAIVVTQGDVRQVQLGKAALAAGCRILLERAQAKQPDVVLMAGAFGSYIDPEAAKTIGLIPALTPEKIKVVGNAAGHGACLSLLNVDKRKEIALLAPKVDYIELSGESRFSEEFISSTALVPWGK